jgi:hypothetical protein
VTQFEKKWPQIGSCNETRIPHPTTYFCRLCHQPVCAQHQEVHAKNCTAERPTVARS